MSNLADSTHATYVVNGMALAFDISDAKTADWETLREKYKRSDLRPTSEIIDDYLAIHALLPNATKGILLHPPYRLGTDRRVYAEKIEELTTAYVHYLVPLGWKLYPVPADAPPLPDSTWNHYDSAWCYEFMRRVLLDMRGANG